jgi:hypothetical protein
MYLSTSFDWKVEASVGCGAKAGPLAASIGTYTQPNPAASGQG